MHGRANRDAGFSLLELTVAVLILSAVAVAIAATLSAGVKVWSRATGSDRLLPDVLVTAEILKRDLGNAARFYGQPFRGGGDQVTFASLLPRPGSDGTKAYDIGTVSYRFDGTAGRLMRRAWRYPGAAPDERYAESVGGRLGGLVFSYLVELHGEAGKYVWRSDAGQEERVHAVRIVLTPPEDAEGELEPIVRTVFLHL